MAKSELTTNVSSGKNPLSAGAGLHEEVREGWDEFYFILIRLKI